MIGVLGFVLELAAVGAAVGIAASALVAPLWRIVPKRTLAPALRSDLAFLAGIAPALASIATVVAAGAPSLVAVLGGADHCLDHGHHLHICIVHAESLRPPLAFLGTLALAVGTYRFGKFVVRELSVAARLRALVALAGSAPPEAPRARFPTLWIPGAPRLCHAAGLIRPRIFVSRALVETLPADLLHAALAHEEAHLARRAVRAM